MKSTLVVPNKYIQWIKIKYYEKQQNVALSQNCKQRLHISEPHSKYLSTFLVGHKF